MIISYFKLHIAYWKTLSTLFFFLPFFANGQKTELKTWWTNGIQYYSVYKTEDSIIHFTGADLHESGYGFSILIRKEGQMLICKNPDQYSSSFGDYGDIVEVKTINNHKVLLVKNKNNELKGLLRASRSADAIRNELVAIKTNHELAGKYMDPFSHKEVVFFPDKRIATGLSKLKEYEFEDSYDFPTDVITFSRKESFYYVVTNYGLDIFKANITQSSDWEKGKKLMSLIKTSWLNTDSLRGIAGKYPFASSVILTNDILGCYTSEQLGIMRNEIFARHGLVFKTEQVRTYFSKQNWYKPESENVDDKLTELEKLNIRFIQRSEFSRK